MTEESCINGDLQNCLNSCPDCDSATTANLEKEITSVPKYVEQISSMHMQELKVYAIVNLELL